MLAEIEESNERLKTLGEQFKREFGDWTPPLRDEASPPVAERFPQVIIEAAKQTLARHPKIAELLDLPDDADVEIKNMDEFIALRDAGLIEITAEAMSFTEKAEVIREIIREGREDVGSQT